MPMLRTISSSGSSAIFLRSVIADRRRFGFGVSVKCLSFQDSINRRQDILLDHTSQEFVSDPAKIGELSKNWKKTRNSIGKC